MFICVSGRLRTYLLSMSRFRGKCARFVALLALLAGLVGAAVPGFAAPAEPKPTLAAMAGCDHDGHHHPAPPQHLPASDCCMVNVCAMSLTLPAPPWGLMAPVLPKSQGYDLRTLSPPAGIVSAPTPHPPKPTA
jgi:hypothetical protein